MQAVHAMRGTYAHARYVCACEVCMRMHAMRGMHAKCACFARRACDARCACACEVCMRMHADARHGCEACSVP